MKQYMFSMFYQIFCFVLANPCYCEEYREKFQGYIDDIAKYSYSASYNGGKYKYVFKHKFFSFIYVKLYYNNLLVIGKLQLYRNIVQKQERYLQT